MGIQGGNFLEEQIVREENCASMFSRYASNAGDRRLAQMFDGFCSVARAHTSTLRSLLGEHGVATDAVVQNRVTPDSPTAGLAGGAFDAGPAAPGYPSGNVPPVRGRDEDMVDDAFLALKVLSEAYRAGLRQSGDESLSAALIGMRKEIDAEKEQLARYLHGGD